MSQFLLAFMRNDIIFLFLILCLFGSLIYYRRRLGKNNELLALLMLGNAKVVLFMSFVAYLWDGFLLSSEGFVFYSTAFFFSGISMVYVKAMVVIFSFFILVLAESFFSRHGRAMAVEFPLFLLLAVFSIFGAIQASDLMTMALFMEMLSYCLFVMPILYRMTNLSLEALLKYFILGSLSSAFLLMGTSLVYATFGTVNYSYLYALLSMGMSSFLSYAEPAGFHSFYGTQVYLSLGFVFLFSALFFKLGLVPFHYWVRDVYEGSPLPVVAFFATVAKIPAVLILAKLVFLLLHSASSFNVVFVYYLEITGLLSIGYGTFFAFYQTRTKSLFALSSVINMGFISLSLSLNSLLGFFVAFNYLFTYCFTALGLFFVLLGFSTKRGSLTRITDVAIILRAQGLLGWLFALTLLSAAGMPPLPGFFPKLLVMWAFYANGDFFIVFFLALASVVNFILYIRLIRFMYFFNLRKDPLKDRGDLQGLDKVSIYFLFVCFFGSIFFSLLLPLFFWNYMAASLCLC